jgi:DNA-binding CsgD family transcriptional regulator
MWRSIWIGPTDEIASYDIIDVSYDLLFLGMCLAFVAYNFVIYLASSRRSVAPLLFALFFLSLSVRVPTLGSVLVTRALPGLSWHVIIFLEYMTGHLIIAFFCTALHSTYPHILDRVFSGTVVTLMGGFSLFLITAGVTNYSRSIHVFLVVAVVLLLYPTVRLSWAAINGNKEVRVGIVAALVVLAVVVSEWVHFSELLLSRDATPLGFLLGLLPVPPSARTGTHLVITVGTLVLIITAASLLLYKVSDGLFGVAAREAVAEEPVTGHSDHSEDAESLEHQVFPAAYNLTTREREIALHVAEGLSNKEIAAVLFVSEATVRTHIYRIFKKTNSKNRTELSKSYFKARTP